MTLHFHGTPITPLDTLYRLAGRCFAVSHMRPEQIRHVHGIGQSVMLDNGAYSKWQQGFETDWPGYYAWCERWLVCPTTWAVPPDEVDAPSQIQDALLTEWPFGKLQTGPVWHTNEPIFRLCRLVDAGWSRVCIGSAGEHAVVLSEAWERRLDEAWDQLISTFGKTPPIHMLRGMQCAGKRWPFASLDSSDVGQNHHRPQNDAQRMAERWDAVQCPEQWTVRRRQQLELDFAA